MTDVAGPAGPPLRFSSLLIRGADAATAAGADGSGLEANCNMAQAFEIPMETGQRPDDAFLPDGILTSSRTRFPDRRSRPADPSAGSITAIWDCLRFAASAQISVRCAPRRGRFQARRSRQD